ATRPARSARWTSPSRSSPTILGCALRTVRRWHKSGVRPTPPSSFERRSTSSRSTPARITCSVALRKCWASPQRPRTIIAATSHTPAAGTFACPTSSGASRRWARWPGSVRERRTARAGADRRRGPGAGGAGESDPQTDRVRGPADVQPGPEPDPREPSRLDRYARPLHGRGHGDGARCRPPLVRAPGDAPRPREGDGHACGEALPGADHVRLLRWLTGGGEPGAWLGGSDPGYPAGRRASGRRFAACPGRERRRAR